MFDIERRYCMNLLYKKGSVTNDLQSVTNNASTDKSCSIKKCLMSKVFHMKICKNIQKKKEP